MPWPNSKAGSNIPAAVRAAVRKRDNDQCQLRYPGCGGRYQQLDHITNLASRGIDRQHDQPTAADLQVVCRPCHNRKTAAEAAAARTAWRRPAPKHPALRHPQPPALPPTSP